MTPMTPKVIASPVAASNSTAPSEMPNHHLTKPVLLGEVQANGQFNVVWETSGLVVAQPWSPYLPESKNLIGDWLPPMSCGNYDVKAGKCLGTTKA